ncbi:MAG TPA: IPT/TIG domain-containing protein, partial [Candidatus Polarisedimenticolia bacterium]|nr:IPT/TIG domain-containing protein [Candidatus Polarisedimenticolia bacterium]
GVYATFSTSYGGKPILSRNVFLGNRAWSNAGGGVMIYPFYSQGQVIDIAVTDNFILGNRSFNNRGGGLALSTQAQYNYNVLRLRAVGNVIGSNRAVSGAGLALASLGSGDHFDLLLDNNLVFGNTAAGDGGGILFSGIGHFAGTLSGTTVTGNTGGVDGGGGIRFSAGPVYEPGFAATNLIVWQNLMNDVSGGSFLTYSTVGGGAAGTGNIAADPQFDSGPMGQFYLAQAAGTTSPAVDAGGGLADEFSMEGQTTDPELAPDAGMVDMGYHYPPDASDSPDPLVIGRVDPPQGDLGGSDWVLIRGTGFDPGAAVFFDSVAATDLIYVSSRRLLAMPPSHAAGAVSVRIANPDASEVTQASAYTYLDNTPPSWQTTTGLQSASSGQDCVRTVTLEWNAAVDTTSPPVRYAVHRELCVTGSGSVTIPCDNFTYTPTAANRVATTTEMFYTDSNFASGGADPKYIYMIRALDSATPFANTEYNYSKRVVLVTKDTSDLTPPPPIGDTVHVPVPTLVDWDGVPDAVSYGLYRRTDPADYGNPGALTPFLTLTSANNDVDMDGVTDTQYVDNDTPAAGTAYFYKITAFDRCGNESRTDL